MEIKEAIIHYCRYAERCHTEVRQKLWDLGCSGNMLESYMADLIAMDLLNEERFAKAYARGKFRMLQWGRVKIKVGLRQRKISEYCIAKAMKEIEPEAYRRTLEKLADKKFRSLKSAGGNRHHETKAKMVRYLLGKGFEQDIIIDLVNVIMEK